MRSLDEKEIAATTGGLLAKLFGIAEIDAGMTAFAVGTALVAVAGAGWAVGTWIANHGGAEAGGAVLCRVSGDC